MIKRLILHFSIPFFLFIVIPFLNFLVLYKSFNLALYGDDWLQLYNLWLEFEVRKTLSYFDIRSYLGAYLPQYIFLGIIHNFAGYEPKAYFFTSFLLKVFSSISIYFLVKEISKKGFIAVLSTLLFIVSAAGLETTDWVFNMNTFAGLGFFCFAAFFYLKTRIARNFFSGSYFLFVSFLALSLFVVPVRVHGAVPFLILTELFLSFIIEKRKLTRQVIFRVLTAVLILFIFIKIGSYGTPEYSRARTLDAFKLVQPQIAQGKFDFVFYSFGTSGNIILPDKFSMTYLSDFAENNFVLRKVPFNIIFLLSFIIFLVNLLLIKTTSKQYQLVLNAILGLILVLIGMYIKSVNPSIALRSIFSILLGVDFFGLGLVFFYLRKSFSYYFITSIFLSIFWVICFNLIYWIYSPHLILDTSSRYLTFGAVGISIYIATIVVQSFSFMGYKILRLFTLALLLFILITNYISGQSYFSFLEKARNEELTRKSWDRFLAEVPKIDEENPSVFYFTTDNPASLFGVFTFGFWPKAGMIYQITDPEKTPLATDNYDELLSYAKTGEPLKKVHGRKQVAVRLDHIFAFDFSNGLLINRTPEIRKQLLRDLNR